MSKKNDKNRTRAYNEQLKEIERNIEAERKAKQDRRDMNRSTNKLMTDINEISLNLEKDERMEVEQVSKKRPKKVARKKKTSS
jgi:hypothetical protein